MSFDGRSSSASSIDSTGSFETLQDSREMELQRLRTENSLLEKELIDKTTVAQELRESTLKTQISGAWKIVASRNVEEFLEKREGSEVDDIVFQLADIHFRFDEYMEKVTVFHKIGAKRYDEKDLSLDGPKWSDGTCSTTYFTEKSMKIVDGELAEQEVSVEDGNLKIVEKVGEISCERIYRRKTEEDPTNVEDLTKKVMELAEEIERLSVEKQSAEEMVEKLQGDTKEMFQGYKDLVEMFLAKKGELDTEREKWMAGKQKYQRLVEKLQKDLKEQSLEKDVEIENLKSTVVKIKEENEKFQQTIEELQKNQKKQSKQSEDIKKSITGTWRDKKNDAKTVHFKIDDQGNILQKWYGDADFIVRTLCVRDAFGWTFYFENNRLVGRKTNPNGTTIHRTEWFVEDGDLILVAGFTRTVFEKI